jgi:Ca-activated chloride channel family protein
MQALDFELNGKRHNRLDVVKSVVEEFVSKRPHDRIGMVVFGTEAYTQCPLTLDHGVLLQLMRDVRIGAAGDSTAIGQALGVATKRLKDLAAKSKIVILLTDGVNNAGALTPDLAAEAAASLGVKVYTVGAGTREEAPFPVEDPLWGGERIVYQQVPIDEDALKRIAATTGGRFFRATDTKELRSIYGTIDALEKTDVKVSEKAEYEERYVMFVVLALAFAMLAVVLQEWRLRVFP